MNVSLSAKSSCVSKGSAPLPRIILLFFLCATVAEEPGSDVQTGEWTTLLQAAHRRNEQMSRRGRQLPPVRLFKCATPVKALRFAPTSVPPLTAHSSCTALTRRGLGKPTRTGSRGRGRGLRQTLDRRLEGRLAFGRKDDSGTAWATPLERASFMLQYWCVVRYCWVVFHVTWALRWTSRK